MENLFGIKNKTALITGGSRGLGLMIARAYVRAGVKVYVSSRKKDVCDRVAAELSEIGDCISLPADLSTEAGVKALVLAYRQLEDSLDILVNNAGRAWGAPFEEYPDKAWDKVMALNVKAVFNLTRDMLPWLAAAANPEEPARVINIGSVAAETTDSLSAYAYGASKSVVHYITRVLAREFAARHITVNAIAPGRFPTDMTTYVLKDPPRYEAELTMIPLGRYGREQDIAGLAILLASPAGSYMTGNIIPLDGGMMVTGPKFPED